jgi:recombination protein U
MKNLGKIFEENWKKSVPTNVFYYRFRDSGSSFYGGNQQLRFSASNIADCLIQDPFSGLHLIELKNHKGKSIPLSCIIGNKTKEKQMKDLFEANKYSAVYSHIIVFFSDVERCFELDIDSFMEFVDKGERKSIPIEYFERKGWEIEVEKLRTNYRFNIEKWLKEF